MIQLNINGSPQQLDIDPDTPLLWAIRDNVGFTGTKYGCGLAQCGACTVHLDGEAIFSCITPVMVRCVLFSIPLDADTIIVSLARWSAIFKVVSRTTCDGTTTSNTSLADTTSARSLEGCKLEDSLKSGRKTEFSPDCWICSLTSSSNTHQSIA